MTAGRYCRECGTALDAPGHEDSRKCPGCDRVWYSNMAPTVGAAIVRDGLVLTTIRAFDPLKGKVDVPGGFLGPHEHPIDGLKRELMEELSIEVDASVRDVVQMVPHEYGDDGQWVLSIGFKVRWISGEPTPGDDVADIRWMNAQDLDNADFAWEHDRELLRRALQDG